MAAWTSRAAPFTSRFRSNCIVTDALPVEDDDVIWLIPAILLNCRSSGVATAEAIVSGSAPGRLAFTEITGYSTCGKLDTGNILYATAPARITAIDNRNVATGRLMNGAEKWTPFKSIAISRHLRRVRAPAAPARGTQHPLLRYGRTAVQSGRRTGTPPAS